MEKPENMALADWVSRGFQCKKNALRVWVLYQITERAILLLAEEGGALTRGRYVDARKRAVDLVSSEAEAFAEVAREICPEFELGDPEPVFLELMHQIRRALGEEGAAQA